MDDFNEQVDMTDLIIDEMKEKLGDNAGVVAEHLINIKTTMSKAGDIHAKIVDANQALTKRNGELLEVNNNLFIKNSDSLKRAEERKQNEDIIDDEDPLDAYISEKMK